uniref:phosphoinositide phospholipase C n=1 Tax=Entomoneis paludosa TaxID=265537 RepID=A0A7S2Y369_9STRA
MVALNFQTPDTPLIINDGRFRENKRCGYILKPQGVLPEKVDMLPTTVEDDENDVLFADRNHDEEENDTLDTVMESMEGVVCGDESSSSALLQKNKRDLTSTNTRRGSGGVKVAERMKSFRQHMTNRVNPLQLRIRVLAGSCLPKPEGQKMGETIDPYVSVTLHDVKEAGGGGGKMSYVSSTFETKVVDNNGYCPIWKGGDFKKFQVLNPQVAMLQFALKEKDVGSFDDRVAEAAIPCNRLRVGYRSVQLFDLNNTRTGPFGFASLLVEIEIDAAPSAT